MYTLSAQDAKKEILVSICKELLTHYTSRLSSSHLEEMLCEMNWSQPSG